MSKIKLFLLILLIILLAIGLFLFDKLYLKRALNIPVQEFETATESTNNLATAPPITTFATNQRVVWAMDFLPDGRLLFTERDGAVNIVETNGEVREIATINVLTSRESGLLGIAIDPDYPSNQFVYLYYTYAGPGGSTENRVSRYTFNGSTLTDETIIIDIIPGAATHDGGRIAFGPDGFLYITTGDAQTPSLSQDKNSLAGKILRVTRDGEAAPNNPFGTTVYSYGHRNPQGIAWDSTGRLWSTEHGPSTRDELNLIEPGGNYGWPTITGSEIGTDLIPPVIQSSQSTWAPAGVALLDDSVFFAGLRGSALYEYNPETEALTTHLKDTLGRIRDVVVGPDGFLYVATSNHDGRGLPVEGDDRILRINPMKLDEL